MRDFAKAMITIISTMKIFEFQCPMIHFDISVHYIALNNEECVNEGGRVFKGR